MQTAVSLIAKLAAVVRGRARTFDDVTWCRRGGDDARRLGRVVRPADDDEQVDRMVDDDDVHGGRWNLLPSERTMSTPTFSDCSAAARLTGTRTR